jgi:hypothetical protein
MFRNNPIGIVLVAACCVMIVALLWQIVTGDQLSYNGPNWIVWVLGTVMIGGSLYALFQGKFRKQDQQWPNPGAGRRTLWDRIRGKNDNK